MRCFPGVKLLRGVKLKTSSLALLSIMYTIILYLMQFFFGVCQKLLNENHVTGKHKMWATKRFSFALRSPCCRKVEKLLFVLNCTWCDDAINFLDLVTTQGTSWEAIDPLGIIFGDKKHRKFIETWSGVVSRVANAACDGIFPSLSYWRCNCFSFDFCFTPASTRKVIAIDGHKI